MTTIQQSFTIDRINLETYICDQYLLSDEQRELKFGEPIASNPKCRMVTYKKDTTHTMSEMARQCRSLIFDIESCNIVSISLAGSSKYHYFAEENNVVTEGEYQMTDIIEGTMINLFWTGTSWEIYTKNNYGGNTRYYSDPTDTTHNSYRSMFLNAIGIHNDVDAESRFQSHPFISGLCKTITYSLVLHHPKNQRCFEITESTLILVAMIKMDGDGEDRITSIPQRCFDSEIGLNPYFRNPTQRSGLLRDAQKCQDEITLDLLRQGQVVAGESVWVTMYYMVVQQTPNAKSIGVMITNTTTGKRTKIIFVRYMGLTELRGNHPNHMVLYLHLVHTQGRVFEFLQAFPFYDQLFNKYAQIYGHYSGVVYNRYVEFFCQRKRDVPKIYMNMIHSVHNDVYRPTGLRMSLLSVMAYLPSVPTLELYKNVIAHHKLMIETPIGDDNV